MSDLLAAIMVKRPQLQYKKGVMTRHLTSLTGAYFYAFSNHKVSERFEKTSKTDSEMLSKVECLRVNEHSHCELRYYRKRMIRIIDS